VVVRDKKIQEISDGGWPVVEIVVASASRLDGPFLDSDD
jgi:hypothetical protein